MERLEAEQARRARYTLRALFFARGVQTKLGLSPQTVLGSAWAPRCHGLHATDAVTAPPARSGGLGGGSAVAGAAEGEAPHSDAAAAPEAGSGTATDAAGDEAERSAKARPSRARRSAQRSDRHIERDITTEHRSR